MRLTLVALLPVVCGAQSTLVEWDAAGVDQSTAAWSAFVFAPGIDPANPSGVLMRGVGAALPGGSSSSGLAASGFNAASLSDALAAGDYFTFSLTAAPGFALNLSSVEYNMEATSSGPTEGALFSSVTGFGSSQALVLYDILPGTGGGDQTLALASITALQGVTGTIEFRIYAWAGGGSTVDKLKFRSLASGDLEISGDVVTAAVPEPADYAVIVGGTVLAGACIRRRPHPAKSA